MTGGDIMKNTSEIDVDWSGGAGTNNYTHVVRFGSTSSQTSQSSADICRICHCESDPQNPLLTPCYCSGSLKYVHQTCLQQWLTASETNSCELCKFPFIMHTKIKPFNEWRALDMSGVERRRLCCAVLFHFAAALCVIWSLCVLIEKAAEEVKIGRIGWPFWTKLAVVTVGLTGGVVFLYIQCRQYLHLCHRWRARNRILLIQNAPEKIRHSPPSPVLEKMSNPSSRTTNNTFNYNFNNSPQINQEGSCGGADRSSTCASVGSGLRGTQLQHGQVVANIENTERDWGLDDVVSQISSFRPCAQGSGSMTPFHDSIHNVLENSTSPSHSDNGSHHDLPVHEEKKGNSQQYPNSSIFLENQDILNDPNFPKPSYRHSSVVTSPEISAVFGENFKYRLDEEVTKELRRYSDTKLLGSEEGEPFIITKAKPKKKNHTPSVHPQITDIIFEKPPLLDPLEAHISKNLDIEYSDEKRRRNRGSGGGSSKVENFDTIQQQIDKNRMFFKSLPNLSSSCESLIKK